MPRAFRSAAFKRRGRTGTNPPPLPVAGSRARFQICLGTQPTQWSPFAGIVRIRYLGSLSSLSASQPLPCGYLSAPSSIAWTENHLITAPTRRAESKVTSPVPNPGPRLADGRYHLGARLRPHFSQAFRTGRIDALGVEHIGVFRCCISRTEGS